MIRRRKRKIQWFLTTVFTIFVSGTILYKNMQFIGNYDRKSLIGFKIPKKSLLSVINTPNINSSITEALRKRISTSYPGKKHVTKSMSQLGKMDEVNEHFLFLNSVPKSGSEILIFILEKIKGDNSFQHVRLKEANRRSRVLTEIQQETIVDEIYEIRRNMAVPLSFDRSVYFINFTTFDKQLPIYINLIRHPVAKVMARAILKKTGSYDSYFIRCLLDSKRNCNFKSGRPYDLTIPYFCGHDPRCLLLNNDWAFESAKRNVEKYYRVVGVLEELNITLDALEHRIPQFFTGARVEYQERLLGSAIKCWDCLSDADSKCADPFGNKTLAITNNCDQVKLIQYSFDKNDYKTQKSSMCRKIRQKVNGVWKYLLT